MDNTGYSQGEGGVEISMNGTVLTDGVRELLVPDELHGRVDESKNTLEEFQVYSKLKRSKYFEARPDTVHFSGFVLGHRHQKIVKIVNVSHLTKRIHVLPCQSPYFTVHFNKKGKIAPGMSEELVVEFTPNEWRYYYDCIRVHQEDQNLLIPIHAYPTVAPRQGAMIEGSSLVLPSQDSDRNGVYFPSKIDFGFCRLSERVEKYIPIRNPVPVEFEFEISVAEKHADIEVEPMRGTVPPHGEATITVSYTPSRMVTAEMKVDLNISQFGFKAQRVVIMGSVMARATRDATINELTHHLRSTGQLSSEQSLENYSAIQQPGDGRINLTVVHDEAKGFADKVAEARMTRRPGEPIHLRRAQPPEPEPGSELNGVMIPADLRPRASTQKVLNQVTGKLSWKELKRQMEENGDLQQEEKLDPKAKANESINWYDTKRMQPGGFLDIEEEYGEGARLQVIEFRYDSELRMRQDYDKAKDVKYFPAIGDDPTTEEELALVAERREQRRRAREQQQREKLRQQKGTIADESLKVAHEVGRLPQIEPTFDPYLNDAWTVRKEITSDFRAQMHKMIVRNRVSRRIERITHKLEQGGLTGGGASSQLVDTILAADSAPPTAVGGARGPADGKMANMKVDQVVSCTFPVYRDGNFRDRDQVPVIDIEPMRDWDFLELKVPCTYKLMDYRTEIIAPVPTYVSLETNRQFRQGAAQEQGIRSARGQADPDAKPSPVDPAAPLPPTGEQQTTINPVDMKIPLCFKLTPHALCNPTIPGKAGGQVGFDSPRNVAATSYIPLGAGGRSICRSLDSQNRAQEGRAKGRCMVYAPLLDHVETDLDFPLRVFRRVVGDHELDGSLEGAAGTLGRALNPSARGQPLDAAIFGLVFCFLVVFAVPSPVLVLAAYPLVINQRHMSHVRCDQPTSHVPLFSTNIEADKRNACMLRVWHPSSAIARARTHAK